MRTFFSPNALLIAVISAIRNLQIGTH